MEEKIGNMNKPNWHGILPYHVDHKHSIKDLPNHILSRLPSMIQEVQWADYLIITPYIKKDIVLDQLKDLALYKPDDHKKNLVH